MSVEEECKCPPEGLPAYMGTFADLMALLMCFFVLLLAFSEMDVLKFKQIAGSMRYAFGVQTKVDVKDIPKGTSVVAQEFSPGRPDATPIESIMQHTMEMTKEVLQFEDSEEVEGAETEGEGEEGKTPERGDGPANGQADSIELSSEVATEVLEQQAAAQQAQLEQLAREIAFSMSEEIESGQVELLAQNKQVVIRIRERGSFSSGSDVIENEFLPVLAKIRTILQDTDGEIRVAGHTDNLPIDTERFGSNWELSGGRAAMVTRELLRGGKLPKERFVITGYADTRPVADNATAEGRAANRRVEIIIVQGDEAQGQTLDVGLAGN